MAFPKYFLFNNKMTHYYPTILKKNTLFSFLTLQPNSTVSLITILLK